MKDLNRTANPCAMNTEMNCLAPGQQCLQEFALLHILCTLSRNPCMPTLHRITGVILNRIAQHEAFVRATIFLFCSMTLCLQLSSGSIIRRRQEALDVMVLAVGG